MSITKQEAAASRAQAAKTAEAKDRLTALEVERNGYVQRGDKKGVKAVDDEIAHWSKAAGIPVESAQTTPEPTPTPTPMPVPTQDQTPTPAPAPEPASEPAARGRAKAAASAKD